MAIIEELLEQYKKHQLELLKESSPIIQHEFESVHELSTCTIIEVFVLRNSKVNSLYDHYSTSKDSPWKKSRVMTAKNANFHHTVSTLLAIFMTEYLLANWS